MKKQFVTYDIAKKLKELGFDEPCFTYFDSNKFIIERRTNYIETVCFNSKPIPLSGKSCTAPLWQQATDWLLNKHSIYIKETLEFLTNVNSLEYTIYDISRRSHYYLTCVKEFIGKDTSSIIVYEKTILKALELIKEK